MDKHIALASFLANILDSKFKILGIKFGANALIDLIPGFGDILAAVLSFYIVWIGIEMGLPGVKIFEMIKNIIIAFIIGIIPVIGDVGYIFYKPNIKNLEILKTSKKNLVEGQIVK